MSGNTTYGFLMGAVLAAGICSGLYWAMKPSAANQISKPEIVFEAPKKTILECEDSGKVSSNESVRCTDKERDVTCYVIRPSGSTTSMSCLPNQWLNYPQSIANVNDPMQQ